MKETDNNDQDREGSMAVWDCGSPLYDSYELVSLGHLLDRHAMILPSLLTDVGSRSSGTSRSRNLDRMTRSSSVVGSFSQFVGWKRRIVHGERKDKAKKLKTGLYGFYNKVGFWRKLK